MTKNISFLFPGQGSQYVGMGKDFYENSSIARDLFQEANDLLNYDIKSICFKGPQEILNLTENTQPAILITSIIALKIFSENGIEVKVAAGHSLGEFSALVASEALSFSDAVPLVNKRGKFMQKAVPAGNGAMAAIIGLKKEKINDLCNQVTEGFVQPANYNSAEQIVISGEKDAVFKAMKLAKNDGAKLAILLPVSAPSHSLLMKDAQDNLVQELKNIRLSNLKFPVVTNVDAIPITQWNDAKTALERQLTSPVRWDDSMQYLIKHEIDTTIELGPGKILSGIMKRIDKKIKNLNVENMKSLEATLQEISTN